MSEKVIKATRNATKKLGKLAAILTVACILGDIFFLKNLVPIGTIIGGILLTTVLLVIGYWGKVEKLIKSKSKEAWAGKVIYGLMIVFALCCGFFLVITIGKAINPMFAYKMRISHPLVLTIVSALLAGICWWFWAAYFDNEYEFVEEEEPEDEDEEKPKKPEVKKVTPKPAEDEEDDDAGEDTPRKIKDLTEEEFEALFDKCVKKYLSE